MVLKLDKTTFQYLLNIPQHQLNYRYALYKKGVHLKYPQGSQIVTGRPDPIILSLAEFLSKKFDKNE